MLVRRYQRDDDNQAIASIYAKSWKSAYRGILPQEYLDNVNSQKWMNIFEDTSRQMFLAIQNETIIGVITCSKARDDRWFDWGEIVSIYLLPDYYHHGIGTKLLQVALQELINQGYKQIYLWVLEENQSAIAFYKKNGFKESKEIVQVNIGGRLVNEIRLVYIQAE